MTETASLATELETLWWCPHWSSLNVNLHEKDPITGTLIPCGPGYFRRDKALAVIHALEARLHEFTESVNP